MKNRYSGSTTLSERRVLKIVECFTLDISALKAAAPYRVNKNTTHRYDGPLRSRVIELAIAENQPFVDEIEVDASYFGPRRVRGKRGRGASGKVPVIGLLKRGECVFVKLGKFL